MRFLKSLLFFILLSPIALAQYAPPAGQEGSTAIAADSAVWLAWASRCTVTRGWMNIADTSLGKVWYGTPEAALGEADNGVVSLGDGGEAVVYFDQPVTDGPGWDFAVFENGFSDDFLELAFVEVSSDSVNFFRFPSVSLTPANEQVDGFGTLDATKIHNLAGKYRVLYGTPFDLEELKDQPGLDVQHIVAVRIIDVVGCISDEFARFDSQMHKINDPWPTPFETGGFDLDAVGVMHNSPDGVENQKENLVRIYPNPCSAILHVEGNVAKVMVRDGIGKIWAVTSGNRLDVSQAPDGLLLLQVFDDKGKCYTRKVIKR